MSNLRNMWSEGIQKLENARTRCTDDDENNNEMDGIEAIDLCSASRCGNDTISEKKESAMQESQDKLKHDETNKKVDESKTVRDESTTKKDNVESAMMCRESTESLVEKEHREKPEKVANKLVEMTEKQKHEAEHVEPTLNTGNRLKISIKEFSWEREGDGSTLGMEEPEQQEIVYITNLEDGLQKDGTTLYNEEGPNKKKPAARNRPIEVTEKQKHEEEHVEPTLNTGNRLKISIEEFSWEREGDGSTLGMEEPEQQEIVYITNLEDGLRKDGTTLYNEEGPNKKSLLRETGLLKCPP